MSCGNLHAYRANSETYVYPGVETGPASLFEITLDLEDDFVHGSGFQLRPLLLVVAVGPELHASTISVGNAVLTRHSPAPSTETGTAYPPASFVNRRTSSSEVISCSSTTTPAAGFPIDESSTVQKFSLN